MERFIIQYNLKMLGDWGYVYHENIINTSPKSDVMNVYTEFLGGDRRKAKIFYDKNEAEKVANFFKSEIQIPKIIKK